MRFRVDANSLPWSFVISSPLTITEPESGLRSPQMSLRVTLLPVPLRPNSTKVVPAATEKEISFSTVREPKDLETESKPIARVPSFRPTGGCVAHEPPPGYRKKMPFTRMTLNTIRKIEERTTL